MDKIEYWRKKANMGRDVVHQIFDAMRTYGSSVPYALDSHVTRMVVSRDWSFNYMRDESACPQPDTMSPSECVAFKDGQLDVSSAIVSEVLPMLGNPPKVADIDPATVVETVGFLVTECVSKLAISRKNTESLRSVHASVCQVNSESLALACELSRAAERVCDSTASEFSDSIVALVLAYTKYNENVLGRTFGEADDV